MPDFNYDDLKETYKYFQTPYSVIKINNVDISENNDGLGITDIEVDISSGFEASIASFTITNFYNREMSQYEYKKVKDYIGLGSAVYIALGYGDCVREVFRGFIARVDFFFENEKIPGVEITAMDVKGLMMANNYSKQLKSIYYSDAVKEILEKTSYRNLQSDSGIISKLMISRTSDKPETQSTENDGKASDTTIEMVCESDYEFVVKAAKKFNFEFFSIGGNVYFREAKGNKDPLIELGPGTAMQNFHLEYDITGITRSVEVRGVDAGNGKLITAKEKSDNKISMSSAALSLVGDSKKVYIDPTIKSKEDAGYRAKYLLEDISYHYGTLTAEFIGIPELIPGRFIDLKNLGKVVSNRFYVVNVKHILGDDGYRTKIIAKAAKLDNI